jgi:alkylated DNA repair dioxygenase AlkB
MPQAQLCGRSRTAASFRAARGQQAASVSQPPAEFPWDVDQLIRRCAPPESLPQGGCLLRAALTGPEQRWLYDALHALPRKKAEEVELLQATAARTEMARLNPDNRPLAWVTWVHPYTRESNAHERPTRLLRWAERLMHALAPESREHVVDSMLAQMYAAGGSLLEHRDEDLSWGLGVSLGVPAEFDCLPKRGKAVSVTIRSGDILVGEFGQMPHAVRVLSTGAPAWWRDVDHFGCKARANVLFRQALTAQRQRELAEARARSVYGMSLAELRRKTGKDDAFLSVHLRHAALS